MIVLLPRHLGSLQRLQNHVETTQVHFFSLDHSRFVWREVQPCLLQAPDRVAGHLMVCLYDLLRQSQRVYSVETKNITPPYDNQQVVTSEPAFYERRLYVRHLSRGFPAARPTSTTLVILPPREVNVEYAWEERMIRLEHDLIRAQSIAGLYSTLGGGYFMTRRLQTANTLAREQKRIALLLGNKEMYYKCTINQAYNEIYAGRFKSARMHILQVWVALAHEKHFDEKQVLQNMCKSAMLFRRRVREARRMVPKGNCRLVDDFSRIRVVQDQSAHHDLTVWTKPRAHAIYKNSII